MAKNTISMEKLVIVILLAGVLLVGTGTIQLGAAPALPVGDTITEGICPTTGLTDIRLAAFNDLDPNDALVATNGSTFLKGDSTPVETVRTSATAFASTSVDLACGTDYFVVFGHGDESNYYEVWVENLNTGMSATNTHKFAAPAVGSLTITGENATSVGIGTRIFVTLGSSEDTTDVTLKLKEATADASFGLGESLVCFDFYTANLTSVEAIGGVKEEVPTLASSNEKCWKVSTPELTDFGTKDVGVFIDTKAGVDPADNITVNVYDLQWFEFKGEKFWTIQDPADDSAIGATDASFIIEVL